MTTPHLPASAVHDALQLLAVAPAPPSLRNLNQLIRAYVHTVPWESASRIVKRHSTNATEDCPRWPVEFWHAAMRLGTGGTCFESNLAFFQLLVALGYEGYLTINNMGATSACHTAIVLRLGPARYLVDVGMPLHRALRLAEIPTRCVGPFHTYSARPIEAARYEIERTRHPQRTMYTLLDTPVSASAYAAATINDYGPYGLFLERVVITKVIDSQVWRFSSRELPFRLEVFSRGGKQEIPLTEQNCVHLLAERFAMSADVIADALQLVASA